MKKKGRTNLELVDVNLDEFDIWVLSGECVEVRSNHLAGTTPHGKVVNHNLRK